MARYPRLLLLVVSAVSLSGCTGGAWDAMVGSEHDARPIPPLFLGTSAYYEGTVAGEAATLAVAVGPVAVVRNADWAVAEVVLFHRWLNVSADYPLHFVDAVNVSSGAVEWTSRACPPGIDCEGEISLFFQHAGMPGLLGYSLLRHIAATPGAEGLEREGACWSLEQNASALPHRAERGRFGVPLLLDAASMRYCDGIGLPSTIEAGERFSFTRAAAELGQGAAVLPDYSIQLSKPPPPPHEKSLEWRRVRPPGPDPPGRFPLGEAWDWLEANSKEHQDFMRTHPDAFLSATTLDGWVTFTAAPPAIGQRFTLEERTDRSLRLQSPSGAALRLDLEKRHENGPLPAGIRQTGHEFYPQEPPLDIDDAPGRILSVADATELATSRGEGEHTDTQWLIDHDRFVYRVFQLPPRAGAGSAGVTILYQNVIDAETGRLVFVVGPVDHLAVSR